MTVHHLELSRRTVHGDFDRDRDPVVTIDPGDTVVYRTLDATWGRADVRPSDVPPPFERDPERDHGHALCGPIYVQGATPDHTLEIRIDSIRPGRWGHTWAGPVSLRPQFDLGIPHPVLVRWEIDADAGSARAAELGVVVPLRPFMGVMGNAPAQPGSLPTGPPRRVGGNLDCRELLAGSTLLLPIEVDGALFSVGDGHAAQGDGEVSCTAIECPMEEVRLTFGLRRGTLLAAPEAETAAGYVTFGIGETLDAATTMAVAGMLSHLERTLELDRARAAVLASVVVNVHVTQIANGILGAHAILPPDAYALR